MKNGDKTTILNTESGETVNSMEGLKILYPANKDFEKKFVLFWKIYDATIGKIIANRVESKSKKIARKLFPNLNGNALQTARNRFGSGAKNNLFEELYFPINTHSQLMRHFVQNVCNAGALDDAYNVNGDFKIDGKKIFPQSVDSNIDIMGKFFLNFPNAQAVRNRYRIVVDLIIAHFAGVKTGTLLSVACGSAQAVLHAVYLLKKQGVIINVTLTDSSLNALAVAKRTVELFNLEDQVRFIQVSFLEISKTFQKDERAFDLVEACGVSDYLSDKLAIRLIKTMLDFSKNKIIFSNMSKIYPHDQVLELTYNWPLVYRTPEMIGALAFCSGGKKVNIYIEPWGIHPVAEIYK
jgi:hypothetical protein